LLFYGTSTLSTLKLQSINYIFYLSSMIVLYRRCDVHKNFRAKADEEPIQSVQQNIKIKVSKMSKSKVKKRPP